ncbi:OmpA family protein [bacterium AH-315-K03]|nr:OmpA family protein [bacterium AH-315-K03]
MSICCCTALLACSSSSSRYALVEQAAFKHQIEIITVPEEAQLYVNQHFIGHSPQTLELAYSGKERISIKAIPSIAGFYVNEISTRIPQVPDRVILYLDNPSGQRIRVADKHKENERSTINLLSQTIYFSHDKSWVSEHYESLLKKWVERINEPSMCYWVLHAYADERGTATYNQELSRARAYAVYNQLDILGVDTSLVSLAVHGERVGFDKNEKELALLLNRSVELLCEGRVATTAL